MSWQNRLKGDPLSWLSNYDDPGVRYLTLRDLVNLPEGSPQLSAARKAAHQSGAIAAILSNMHPDGYWSEPGPGYNPKYFSSVWSLLTLAQLGARIDEDERIARACTSLLAHALTRGGQFTASGAPSGTCDCLQGNLAWALVELGCTDPRLEAAFEWMARTVTGEGLSPMEDKKNNLRYFAGKRGPLFICGGNNNQGCAWGAVKVMLAFSVWPAAHCTPLIQSAILQGAEFLLAGNPAKANYPNGWAPKASQNWWKFGFPVFYITDLLQNVEALVRLGYGHDPRLADALAIIESKQDDQGRWLLEYDYDGKTWCSFGKKKQPNPWVTLRAIRVLKMIANG
jgi:hypothetical protein